MNQTRSHCRHHWHGMGAPSRDAGISDVIDTCQTLRGLPTVVTQVIDDSGNLHQNAKRASDTDRMTVPTANGGTRITDAADDLGVASNRCSPRHLSAILQTNVPVSMQPVISLPMTAGTPAGSILSQTVRSLVRPINSDDFGIPSVVFTSPQAP